MNKPSARQPAVLLFSKLSWCKRAFVCGIVAAATTSIRAADETKPPVTSETREERWRQMAQESDAISTLAQLRAQDVCILPDAASGQYYMVASGRLGVRQWTSKDLVHWTGPKMIFRTPSDLWGDIPIIGIWAPELHLYRGKYYLFLTFDTQHLLAEQWRDWRPRVTRGSQVLVADGPAAPFRAFQPRSTTPPDMMTLDGTLWEEDGVPYMVFCHEWVQITDGTIEYVPLKEDLSATAGEPKRLFRASSAKWSEPAGEGGYVTDGCFLHRGKTGKLYMIWSSRNKAHGYVLGVAISDSGKLAGPWRQEERPIFEQNGGHGMIFRSFEGKLMMVLHAPDGNRPHPLLFEIEDTGETLRIVREVTSGS